MAAAWLNHLADPTKLRALSAGTDPAAGVHPVVVQVMQEVGINLEGSIPQRLTTELASQASLLITMGCGEACPVIPGLRREDWPLSDPKDQRVEQVRLIRDDIRQRVKQLLTVYPSR